TPNGKVDRKALPAPEGSAFAQRGYEPPEGEIETALAQLWAEVLHVERVGRHDNFFELGGHSLMTLRVVNRMNEIGMDITLNDFYRLERTTVAALTAAMHRPPATPGVVTLRAGGTKRPLFLLHEIHGFVAYGQSLLRDLDADIPVYGLPGVPDGEPPPRTIEAMAARFVRLLQQVQPHGPYRLAGWSFGGTLAYEMAAQLIGQDEEVEFLGLIDSFCPTLERFGNARRAGTPQSDLLARCGDDVSGFGAAQHEALAALRQVADELAYDELLQRCRDARILPAYLQQQGAAQVRHHVARLAAHQHAQAHYAVQPLPIRVHLFSAADTSPLPPELAADPLKGWGRFVPQLRLVRVPGTHMTVVAAPHVQTLARALDEALDDAQRAPQALPEMRYRPQLTIQTGRRGANPMFVVPGAGNSVTDFAAWAGAVGEAWPVHGLQPRGVASSLVPHTTVEAAAATCLRAIDEVQPHGPVHLFGHSFGGWVVFQVACLLRERGRQVASLTLVDTEVPGGDGLLGGDYTALEVLGELIEVMELAAQKPLCIRLSDLDPLDDAGRLKLLLEGLVRVGVMPRRSQPEVLQGPVRTFAAALRTCFVPASPYPDPVRLVLVRDTRLDEPADRLRCEAVLAGWLRFAPRATCWRGPGNHMTVLDPPHVGVLAQWWRDGLSPPNVSTASVSSSHRPTGVPTP
ncbi:MAG TPA: alpha/beta fold hydrolase, partial [Albitalea sp.]